MKAVSLVLKFLRTPKEEKLFEDKGRIMVCKLQVNPSAY